MQPYNYAVIKPNNILRIAVVTVPAAVISLILMFRNNIIVVTAHFPPCQFYRIFHLYCPGCGNTRSVISLLNFNVVSSIKYNITPVVLGIIILAFYIELAAYAFGRRVRIVPRKNAFLFSVAGSMLIYYIVRNFFI